MGEKTERKEVPRREFVPHISLVLKDLPKDTAEKLKPTVEGIAKNCKVEIGGKFKDYIIVSAPLAEIDAIALSLQKVKINDKPVEQRVFKEEKKTEFKPRDNTKPREGNFRSRNTERKPFADRKPQGERKEVPRREFTPHISLVLTEFPKSTAAKLKPTVQDLVKNCTVEVGGRDEDYIIVNAPLAEIDAVAASL